MVKREKSNYMIQSVCHALEVLEVLAGIPEMGVTEMSKRLKLHKNNVFRILATLELRGYVQQDKGSENYKLGAKSLEIGQAYLKNTSLIEKAYPVLKELAEKIGETVSLAVLQNGQVMFPLSVESKRPVRVSSRVGVSFPAKSSAAGRLLTAQLSDGVLEEILATNTPQDSAIKNQLSELRRSGLIVDRGAIEPDVVSISVAVRGPNGEAIGAIECLTPQYRGKVDELAASVQEYAKLLSTLLGSPKRTVRSQIEKEVDSGEAARIAK